MAADRARVVGIGARPARRGSTRRRPRPPTARGRSRRPGGSRASTPARGWRDPRCTRSARRPGPRRMATSPCTSSSRSPSRSDSRLTSYWASIVASDGRASPGCRPSRTMSRTRARATISAVFGGRVRPLPEAMAMTTRSACASCHDGDGVRGRSAVTSARPAQTGTADRLPSSEAAERLAAADHHGDDDADGGDDRHDEGDGGDERVAAVAPVVVQHGAHDLGGR